MRNNYRNSGAGRYLPRVAKTTFQTMPWLALVAALSIAGCAKGNSSGGEWKPPFNAALPPFSSAVFSNPTNVNNPYFPLIPDTTTVTRSHTEDGLETGIFEVTGTTRIVNGVTCVQVHDQVYLDDLLLEDTLDWFAQDDAGNVWYFGEDTSFYEYNDHDVLISTSKAGSFEAGLDINSIGQVAAAGIIMEATRAVGDMYKQEYYKGVAEDQARVQALNVMVTLADGRTFTCVQTLEYTPLEEESDEYKWYAPGIGLVRDDSLVLVSQSSPTK